MFSTTPMHSDHQFFTTPPSDNEFFPPEPIKILHSVQDSSQLPTMLYPVNQMARPCISLPLIGILLQGSSSFVTTCAEQSSPVQTPSILPFHFTFSGKMLNGGVSLFLVFLPGVQTHPAHSEFQLSNTEDYTQDSYNLCTKGTSQQGKQTTVYC